MKTTIMENLHNARINKGYVTLGNKKKSVIRVIIKSLII